MHGLICEWCGQKYEARSQTSNGKPRRFCGKSCSAQWRMSRPEYVKQLTSNPGRNKKLSEAMKRHMADEGSPVRRGMLKYARSKRNPFKQEKRAAEIRKKGQATLRRQGYKHLTGGNGQAMPLPQRLLAEALGWKTEYPIPTMTRRKKIPTSYKVDLANPKRKVGVEVDGQSHLTKERRRLDRKKEKVLADLGWRIIRVTNKEVLRDIGAVLEKIRAFTRSGT